MSYNVNILIVAIWDLHKKNLMSNLLITGFVIEFMQSLMTPCPHTSEILNRIFFYSYQPKYNDLTRHQVCIQPSFMQKTWLVVSSIAFLIKINSNTSNQSLKVFDLMRENYLFVGQTVFVYTFIISFKIMVLNI